MQAVKLKPEEVLGGAVRSDWLLLWRVLPKGLPSNGDAGGRKRRRAQKHRMHRCIIYTTKHLQKNMLLSDRTLRTTI